MGNTHSCGHHYDVTNPIKHYCDAYPKGMEAQMMHIINEKEQPLAYALKLLNDMEKSNLQIEQEGYMLIFCVKKFNQYLYEQHFILVTNHQPLCKLLGYMKEVQPLAAACMQRWASTVLLFIYKIEYVQDSS